jgi:hypothetical protein
MVVSIPVMARVGELIAEENYAHANELIQVVRKMAKLKFARGYRIEWLDVWFGVIVIVGQIVKDRTSLVLVSIIIIIPMDYSSSERSFFW